MEGDNQVVQSPIDHLNYQLNPNTVGMDNSQFTAIVNAIKIGNINEEAMTDFEVNAVLALMGIFEQKPTAVKVTEEPTADTSSAVVQTPLDAATPASVETAAQASVKNSAPAPIETYNQAAVEAKLEIAFNMAATPSTDRTLAMVKPIRKRAKYSVGISRPVRERTSYGIRDRHDDTILESEGAIKQLVKTETKRKRTNFSTNGASGLTLGEFARINLAQTLVDDHLKRASNSKETTTVDWKKSRWLADAHSKYEKEAGISMIGQEFLGGSQNHGGPPAWAVSASGLQSDHNANIAAITSTSGANAISGSQVPQRRPMKAKAKRTAVSTEPGYPLVVPAEKARSILPFEPSEEWLRKFTAAFESKTVKQFMAESTFEYADTTEHDKERMNVEIKDGINGTTVKELLTEKSKAPSSWIL